VACIGHHLECALPYFSVEPGLLRRLDEAVASARYDHDRYRQGSVSPLKRESTRYHERRLLGAGP